MLIRSKNKQYLIVLENYKSITADLNGDVLVSNTFFGDDHHWKFTRDNGYADCVVLGNYSTREKALKVLDMIQEAYEGYILEDSRPVGNGYYKQSFGHTKVFQMPQDDEVEE